jgi:hypothetical protein
MSDVPTPSQRVWHNWQIAPRLFAGTFLMGLYISAHAIAGRDHSAGPPAFAR